MMKYLVRADQWKMDSIYKWPRTLVKNKGKETEKEVKASGNGCCH